MGVSSAIALLGIGIAAYFFLFNRAPRRLGGATLPAVHRTLLNKYWIDELYDAAIVQPLRWASDHVLWKVVDVWIIDGIVNGVGVVVRGSAALMRHDPDRLDPHLRGVARSSASCWCSATT